MGFSMVFLGFLNIMIKKTLRKKKKKTSENPWFLLVFTCEKTTIVVSCMFFLCFFPLKTNHGLNIHPYSKKLGAKPSRNTLTH